MIEVGLRGRYRLLAVAVLAIGAVALAGGAQAQDDAAAPAKSEKAEKTEKSDKSSAWVKLCEKAPLSKEKPDEKRDVCITHHERLDPNTGAPIISAAVRTIEGNDKPRFLITVPLGMLLPPGMKMKIDEDKEHAVELQFNFCLANGCTAETDAPPELIEKLSGGKMLFIAVRNLTTEQIVFQVPLNGFKSTLDGKAVDTAKFVNARKQLLMRIREKMIARINEQKEKQKQAKEAGATGKKDEKKEGEATTE